MFVGIGLLLTFLRRYSYSAIALTLLGGVLAVLLGIVMMGLLQQRGKEGWNGKVQLDLPLFIQANYVACAAVISIGAFLGKTTPTQVTCLTRFPQCLHMQAVLIDIPAGLVAQHGSHYSYVIHSSL